MHQKLETCQHVYTVLYFDTKEELFYSLDSGAPRIHQNWHFWMLVSIRWILRQFLRPAHFKVIFNVFNNRRRSSIIGHFIRILRCSRLLLIDFFTILNLVILMMLATHLIIIKILRINLTTITTFIIFLFLISFQFFRSILHFHFLKLQGSLNFLHFLLLNYHDFWRLDHAFFGLTRVQGNKSFERLTYRLLCQLFVTHRV